MAKKACELEPSDKIVWGEEVATVNLVRSQPTGELQVVLHDGQTIRIDRDEEFALPPEHSTTP